MKFGMYQSCFETEERLCQKPEGLFIWAPVTTYWESHWHRSTALVYSPLNSLDSMPVQFPRVYTNLFDWCQWLECSMKWTYCLRFKRATQAPANWIRAERPYGDESIIFSSRASTLDCFFFFFSSFYRNWPTMDKVEIIWKL